MAAVAGSTATRYLESMSDRLLRDAAMVKKPYYQAHFDTSKWVISEAIEGLGKTALILGAGSGLDLPLMNLAERFDLVVLLDVDTRYTRKAVSALPEAAQEKFQIEQADLTGLFEEFVKETAKIKGRGLSFEEFGPAILDMLPSLKRKAFAYQSMQASFVCSSLVSSQLIGGIVDYLNQLSQEAYGKAFDVPNDRKDEYCDWLIQLQMNHLDELNHLVEPQGKVYFADHFSAKGVIHLKSVIEEKEVVLGESNFTGAEKIQEYVKKLFSTLSENKWGWGVPVKSSVGRAEVETPEGDLIVVPVDVLELREYQITSLLLQKV